MKFRDFAELNLSGDVKSRYLQALKDEGYGRDDVEHNGSASSFISCAFCWSGTPQGREYWSEVRNNLGKNPDFYKLVTLDRVIADALELLEKMKKLPYIEYKTMDMGSKADYDSLADALKMFVVEV